MMFRALVLLGGSVFALGCVEPSQARVTETPEQLLNNDDCAAYKPVKGVMPGGGAAAPKAAAEGESQPAPADSRCTGEPAK